MDILLTQQMLHAIKHITGRQRTGVLCVQHSPTAAALSTTVLTEKRGFRVSPFCQIVQKHKLFEMA